MRPYLEVAGAQAKTLSAWQYVIKYHPSNTDALSILSFATIALREEANLLREIERIKNLKPVQKFACI